LPVDAESSRDNLEHCADVEKKSVEWSSLLANVYPLIKIMEVQVCHAVRVQFSVKCWIKIFMLYNK